MHSENGRIKKDKETASKDVRNILICNVCKNEMPARSKVFGEVIRCLVCDSGDLSYKIM